MGCLGRAAHRAAKGYSAAPGSVTTAEFVKAAEEAEAGARAIKHFPRVLLRRMPMLVNILSSALGAIVSRLD